MLKRELLDDLISWKDNPRRKPLILWGARQVGKTFLLRELFAKSFYPNRTIYIDFKRDDDVRSYCENTADAAKIIEFLELRFMRKIDNSTLLILDEIQECPNIISSLKYFCQEFSAIPVIATGSMVRIRIKRVAKDDPNKGFLFPVGKIDQLTLYPLTFKEYLLNTNEMLFNKVRECYQNAHVIEDPVHKLAMEALYRYLLVGGMPEAVNCYVETGNLVEPRKLLISLYDNYLADMDLYQASGESAIRSRLVFRNIYRELSRTSKNFSPSLLKPNTKTRDFRSALDWLETAHVIRKCYQLKEHIVLPLSFENESIFRVYLSDIGMFSYQSGINPADFLGDNRNALSEIFFENYVACELSMTGEQLFFWTGKGSSKFEFIVHIQNELIPVDVKKGKGTLNSLSHFSSFNRYKFAVKFSTGMPGYDANLKILTLPLYMVSFFVDDLKRNRVSVWS